LKLDGYSLNEAYEAVMEDYKAQISEFMTDAADNVKTSGPDNEENGNYAQADAAKILIEQLEKCQDLGPLSSYAKKKLKDAKDAAEILAVTYSINKNVKSDANTKEREQARPASANQ
jgi:hypothetical protein